jgi:tetratricopeptide (TPR) repeat protein
MRHTAFGDTDSPPPGTATSYYHVFPGKDGRGYLEKVAEIYPDFMRSGAGIDSSASELAKWLSRVLAGSFFADKQTLSRMWTAVPLNNGEPGPRTPGWIVIRTGDHRGFGAEGGGRAALAVYPDDGVAVVILTNLAGANPEELLDQIAANYIPGFRLRGILALRIALESANFDRARAVYDDLQSQDPHFVVSESELNRWGYRLMLSGKGDEALQVFKLVVSLHPSSANAYDSLAGGYEALGDKKNSVTNYRRSLELDPKNSNALDRLHALGAD